MSATITQPAKSAIKPAPPPPLSENKLAVNAGEELVRQYQEWRQSFQTPAQRMAFIRNICARIAEAFKPEQIILFGSHAYGTPTPGLRSGLAGSDALCRFAAGPGGQHQPPIEADDSH